MLIPLFVHLLIYLLMGLPLPSAGIQAPTHSILALFTLNKRKGGKERGRQAYYRDTGVSKCPFSGVALEPL